MLGKNTQDPNKFPPNGKDNPPPATAIHCSAHSGSTSPTSSCDFQLWPPTQLSPHIKQHRENHLSFSLRFKFVWLLCFWRDEFCIRNSTRKEVGWQESQRVSYVSPENELLAFETGNWAITLNGRRINVMLTPDLTYKNTCMHWIRGRSVSATCLLLGRRCCQEQDSSIFPRLKWVRIVTPLGKDAERQWPKQRELQRQRHCGKRGLGREGGQCGRGPRAKVR